MNEFVFFVGKRERWRCSPYLFTTSPNFEDAVITTNRVPRLPPVPIGAEVNDEAGNQLGVVTKVAPVESSGRYHIHVDLLSDKESLAKSEWFDAGWFKDLQDMETFEQAISEVEIAALESIGKEEGVEGNGDVE